MKSVLVTGASGFIGRHLCVMLARLGYQVRAVIRSNNPFGSSPNSNITVISVGDLESTNRWECLLDGVECVVHCAGISRSTDGRDGHLRERQYQSANIDATRLLAQNAVRHSVKRFIFLSSVKVYGETSDHGRPIKSSDPVCPESIYAISKLNAEYELKKISKSTSLEVVIVRPPVVYGPDMKGNFYRLLSLLKLGIPLPFASISNKRALIGIENLADFLVCCIESDAATGGEFLVSDGCDLSISDLLNCLGDIINRRVLLFPFPYKMLRFIARLASRENEVSKLIDSLSVDITNTIEIMKWHPPVSTIDGLRKALESG